MCKFFKKEHSNHHFPELNSKKGLAKASEKLFGGSKGGYWIMALAVTLGVCYFAQANVTAAKGYAIKDLQGDLSQLQDQNDKLSLNYIQRQSMANIVGSSAGMDLVPVSNVEVISPAGAAVALR